MRGRKVILQVDDWDGKVVKLYDAQWKHIRTEHPEMADELDAIRVTIADPDAVTQSDTLPLDPAGSRYVASRMDTHSRYRRLYLRVPIEYSQAKLGNHGVR